MPGFFDRLFSPDGFMPHGHCYLWQPEVVWLHVVSDTLIALAYCTIPISLSYFVRRRRDLPFRWMFLAFGTFIVSCGMTHALEVYTLWVPVYWLSGTVKAITAAASLATASLLIPLVPRALALPSPEQLRRVNAELHKSEARFRAAVEGTADAFLILEPVRDDAAKIVDFRVVEANHECLRRMGTTRERALYALFSELISAEVLGIVFDSYVSVVEKGEAGELTARLPAPNAPPKQLAGRRWVHHEIVPLDDGIAVTARDLTSRRHVEDFLLANMTEGVCLVSADNEEIVFANPTLDAMMGAPSGGLTGRPASDVLDATSLQTRPNTYESEETTKDGRRFTCRTTKTELDHPEYGRVWLVTKTDIGEKKALETDMARLAAIVESTNDAITSKSLTGIIETWNAGATRLYGYTSAEMVGKTNAIVVPPELQEEQRSLLDQVARGERVDVLETVRVHKDGHRVDVALTASPIQTPGGEIAGISVIARDISHAKIAERELQASLREKNVLLAEIHHRVKNNLQVVSSLLKLHAEKLTDAAALAAFDDSQTRVRAIALLHETLYHSDDVGAVVVADYAEVLVRVLVHAQGRGNVRYQVEAPGISLPVDEAMPFGLILNELVTNALKHGFVGETSTDPLIRVSARAVGEEIELVVTDNGVGYPVSFDPAASKTLGMHIVLALAGQLGGSIRFSSETAADMGGAVSTLVFPAPKGSTT